MRGSPPAIAGLALYWELAITILITNTRYRLMSCALSQKFAPETTLWHRIGVGFGITDESFGVTMARPGAVEPRYTYGAMLVSIPSWAAGTSGAELANIVNEADLEESIEVVIAGDQKKNAILSDSEKRVGA